MLIWKGLGILVPAVLIPSAFLTMFICNDINTPIANLIFFWIAALLCFAINYAIKNYRNATCEEVIVENKKTGKEKVLLAKRHTNKKTGEVFETLIEDSFFFIPVRFWFVIYIIIGSCYYLF